LCGVKNVGVFSVGVLRFSSFRVRRVGVLGLWVACVGFIYSWKGRGFAVGVLAFKLFRVTKVEIVGRVVARV
jgi:hypothetical protein